MEDVLSCSEVTIRANVPNNSAFSQKTAAFNHENHDDSIYDEDQ